MPAAGSACPMLAFTPPTANGSDMVSRAESTAPTNEPASMGSPSAVPVPCASMSASSLADTDPSASAATSKPC